MFENGAPSLPEAAFFIYKIINLFAVKKSDIKMTLVSLTMIAASH